MLLGPQAVGLDLRSPETSHGRVRALWAQHEAAILAEAERRGIEETWFEGREWFVSLLEANGRN
jgi:hypothetical protein